jgi:hypothetical protein
VTLAKPSTCRRWQEFDENHCTMKQTQTKPQPLRHANVTTIAIWLAAGTVWIALIVLIRGAQ